MLALLKLLQSIIKTLHSEGTPGQVAAGIALGAALGLTPLLNPHNLLIVAAIVLLNVSFVGGMLGWALFVPLGFLLDPGFDRIGRASLVGTPALGPMWTAMYNAPLVPYANFNNTVVLGSVVAWLVLALPIYVAGRGRIPRDSVSASAASLPLPAFTLPVLPVRVDPRHGGLQLAVSLVGDSVDARWAIQSDSVRWVPDSARLASLSTTEALIWRVLSGLTSLDLSARASGPLTAPRLSVRSNLDRAIGDRLKAIGGEEVAKAEARARGAGVRRQEAATPPP